MMRLDVAARSGDCIQGKTMSQELHKVGDLVSRDGHDAWRIMALSDHEVECTCEVAPVGWLRQDGSRGKAWCQEGDKARFLSTDLKPI